jgi:hypothetical protein
MAVFVLTGPVDSDITQAKTERNRTAGYIMDRFRNGLSYNANHEEQDRWGRHGLAHQLSAPHMAVAWAPAPKRRSRPFEVLHGRRPERQRLAESRVEPLGR